MELLQIPTNEISFTFEQVFELTDSEKLIETHRHHATLILFCRKPF